MPAGVKIREAPSRIPFHPLLFASAVPLSLLASNIDQVRPSVATRTILGALILAMVLWAMARIVSGDWRRAAAFASVLIVFLSTYGLAYNFIRSGGELGWELARHRYMLPVWLMLLGATVVVVRRLSEHIGALTSVFNIVGASLILLPLAQIGRFEIESALAGRAFIDSVGATSELTFSVEDQPPDIYYIITDAYSRGDYLLSNYGYDNSQFLDALEEMGFYVARCSQSNYAQTDLSLASSLNLSYLETLGDEFRVGNTDKRGLDRLIREGLVLRELKALGYAVVAFETGFFFTQLDGADHYYELPKEGTLTSFFNFKGINEFEALLIQNTGLRLLTDAANVTGALAWALPDLDRPRSIYRDRTLYVLGQLEPERVPALRGPKFVFVHLITPHFPYVIDREGEFFNVETNSADKEPYINQLIYLNGRLEQIFSDILETAATPPIIVLQADHGNLDVEGERTAILNAYFLPEAEGHKPYPQISPVNTFRLILDNYFGGDYGLLPDQSFYSTYEAPFVFSMVPNTRGDCGGVR